MTRVIGPALIVVGLALMVPVHAQSPCQGGTIALTYDDGPEPETLPLLGALKSRALKATFFMLGAGVEKYPEIAKKVAEEGHAVEIHGWLHEDFTTMNSDVLRATLMKTRDAIQQATGVTPTLVRPPFGRTNVVVHGVIESLGLHEVMWTRDADDWKDDAQAYRTVNAVRYTPSGGLVLMHSRIPPDAITGIADYFTTNDICAGRIVVDKQVMPNLDWPGQVFHAHANPW